MVKREFSIAEARNQLPALVHYAEKRGPVTFTRRGKPVAMLVAGDDFKHLIEKRLGFWAALERFRASNDLSKLGITDAILSVPRDRDSGRRFQW